MFCGYSMETFWCSGDLHRDVVNNGHSGRIDGYVYKVFQKNLPSLQYTAMPHDCAIWQIVERRCREVGTIVKDT